MNTHELMADEALPAGPSSPRRYVAALMAMMVIATTVGCGRSDMGRVSGVIMYEGKPVADAVVSFRPQNRPMAFGRTDAAGRFTLNTYSKGDGATKGVNRVRIEPWTPGPNSFPEPGQDPRPWKEPERPDIPKKYRQEETSGLTVEVIAGKRNEFTFELTTE
jgi:hypothetical protein